MSDWKDFVNGLFVAQDGSHKKAVVDISIKHGDNTLTLPNIEVSHRDSLQDIFIAFRDSLKAQREEGTTDTQQSAVKTKNVEHLKHKNKEYIVYRMTDDSFIVRNPEGKVLSNKAPLHRTLVKIYKDKFKLE